MPVMVSAQTGHPHARGGCGGLSSPRKAAAPSEQRLSSPPSSGLSCGCSRAVFSAAQGTPGGLLGLPKRHSELSLPCPVPAASSPQAATWWGLPCPQ